MAEVSIIILTYNSSRFIEGLLKSLTKTKNAEILVVDNHSKDDTVKLAKKFENIKVIETGENLGFAKGINFGARQAEGKYLLFINPDTQLKSGDISSLVTIFTSHDKVGVVGGKLIDRNGTSEKSCGTYFGFIESLAIATGLDELTGVRYSPDKISKVDFVSGGFMMVDAKLFFGLGGFDEKFFMYVEDMELCYRVKKSGYQVYFTPEVVVEHEGQGSSSREFAVLNIYKGLLYFHKKHKNFLEYRIVWLALYIKAMMVYLLGRITNNSNYISTYGKALELF